MKLKALSLFSSVGLAETYFKKYGIDLCVANELIPNRARFHQHLYPESEMICGDITDEMVYRDIKVTAINKGCNFVIATPPCQGMSTAGKMQKDDPRNKLIIPAIKMIKEIEPLFVIIENVPEMLRTKIFVDNKWILIPDYIERELGEDYNFNTEKIVNAMHYGVPQSRKRCIYLLAKKSLNFHWEFPKPSSKVITLREAIGWLPSLDPDVTDIDKDMKKKIFPEYEAKKEAGLAVSKWHFPPRHKWRHVEAMMHTPEGYSAWDNEIFYPKLKDGTRSKGYRNTYKRQWWDRPAYTITKYTSRLGSQENGHPGRLISDDGTESGRYWSDPRVFSIFELIIVSSLPLDWNIPDWASSNLIRESIGEGIPPKLIEAALTQLKDCKKLKE